jgi:muramoyltetrapeptide carboxypeptidase
MTKNQMRNQWLPLVPGDSVEMIAAGFPFDWKNVRDSEKILSGWDIELNYPKGILGSHPVSANSRQARFQFFKDAVMSDSKIIWAARGGYGSLHLVSELKKIKPPRRKKLLIGFSDNCTLQQYVTQEWGWAALHGPHVDRLGFLNGPRLSELKKILFGQKDEVVFQNLTPMNAAARRPREIRAAVVGGNLMTTQSTLGTPWQIESDGRILFFEEIGERGYRVDRILEHLRLMGVFKKARAVIFGPFVGGEEPDGKNKVPRVLQDFADAAAIPVLRGLPSGHIPHSRSLPIHTPALLKTGRRGQLTVATGSAK